MPITLMPSSASWPAEFDSLSAELHRALGSLALRIDHIGSTSIPGLAAKDVIDAQVIVASLKPRDRDLLVGAFVTAGFARAGGSWNQRDHIPSTWTGSHSAWDKMTFRSGPGLRPANVHVRVAGQPNERYALLFRDFLRNDVEARMAWEGFKVRLAHEARDLHAYGALKDPATDVLMVAAERWASAVTGRYRARMRGVPAALARE